MRFVDLLLYSDYNNDKAKPAERRGRKATGQDWPFKSLLPRPENDNHYRYGMNVRSIILPIALKMNQTIWLPAPIYEALPAAHVVIGTLLLGGVSYVGFHGPMSFVYAGLGIVSVLSGITIRRRRSQVRQSRADES